MAESLTNHPEEVKTYSGGGSDIPPKKPRKKSSQGDLSTLFRTLN